MPIPGFRLPKRTTLHRFIVISMTALSLVYVWICFRSGPSIFGIILSVLTLVQLVFVAALRRPQFSEGSRLGILVVSNLALFVFSLSLGRDFGFHHFYLSLAALPLLLFERQERWGVWISAATPIILYLWIESWGYSAIEPLGMQPVGATVIYWLLLPARFLFLVIGAFYFANVSDKAQARINLTVSELKESVRTSRALLAAIPDMIFRVSDEGRFLDYHCLSDADLFLPPEKLVGKKLSDVLPVSIASALFARVSDALSIGSMEVHSFEFEKNGSVRYYDTRIVSTGANDVLMIVQDVSERVRNEKIILDQRIKGATANKMAALGEMAGGIAHEINNPLAIIHGKAQQLKEFVDTGEIDKTSVWQGADKIEQTAMRISKIVRSLRFFARDGQEDPFEMASISEVVNDTLEFCRERFHNHSIDLRVSNISDEVMIECRAVQIGQVLLNLLNNSHDAVERLSEKWIELAIEDLGRAVQISVTDSGPGIPPELHEKVLQPFFTTKEIGKGTGLGLSISKGIVESHQGTLQIDANVPHTRFVIRLPKMQSLSPSGH